MTPAACWPRGAVGEVCMDMTAIRMRAERSDESSVSSATVRRSRVEPASGDAGKTRSGDRRTRTHIAVKRTSFRPIPTSIGMLDRRPSPRPCAPGAVRTRYSRLSRAPAKRERDTWADRMAGDGTPQGPQAIWPRRHRRARACAPDRHLDAGRRIAFALWLALWLPLGSGAPGRPDQRPERLSTELHHLPRFQPRGKHRAVAEPDRPLARGRQSARPHLPD